MLKYRYKKAWSSILALLFFFYSVLLLNFIFDKQSIVHAHNALGRNKNIILVGDNLEDSPAKKYKMALDAIGLDCEIISVDNFSKDNLDNINFLIIPHDISHSIKKKMLKEIIIEVYSGMYLITEKKSYLAEALGIKFSDNIYESNTVINFKHPEVKINWPEKIKYRGIEDKNLEIFCKDASNEYPIVSGKRAGQGGLIYLSIPFDSNQGWGYSRLPFFHEILFEFADYQPAIQRNNLATYMDWGYHYADDPAKLADRLKTYGVKEVHLSAWYNPEDCAYFFKDFIKNCHRNGILVYAWLELPMVSKDFWDRYPEWREKTASNRDALVDWRYLMALEDPECMTAVKKELKKTLKLYNWDGVDFAEIYFESPGLGINDPDTFTPMSKYIRDEFAEKYDIDPIKLFNVDLNKKYYAELMEKFLEFRVNLITNLNKEMVKFIESDSELEVLDIVITQIDSFLDKKMRKNIGVDSLEFIELQKKYDFTLQIEDPFTLWSLGPDRYKKIVNSYRKNMSKGQDLMVDINIVERGDTIYPTKKQTGLEYLILLSEAGKYADRVSIYGSHSPEKYDIKYSSIPLAAEARIIPIDENTFMTDSPYQFIYRMNTEDKEIKVNNSSWSCYSNNAIIIPEGKNKVSVSTRKDKDDDKIKITFSTAKIDKCYYQDNKIYLDIAAHRNIYLGLSTYPDKIILNNRKVSLDIFDNEGEYTIKIPSGNHQIIIGG